MNPIVHFMLFQLLHTTYIVPGTVKSRCLDRNNLDLLCIPSNIHILQLQPLHRRVQHHQRNIRSIPFQPIRFRVSTKSGEVNKARLHQHVLRILARESSSRTFTSLISQGIPPRRKHVSLTRSSPSPAPEDKRREGVHCGEGPLRPFLHVHGEQNLEDKDR